MNDRKIILGVIIIITLTTIVTTGRLHQGEAVSAPEETKRAAAAPSDVEIWQMKEKWQLLGGNVVRPQMNL